MRGPEIRYFGDLDLIFFRAPSARSSILEYINVGPAAGEKKIRFQSVGIGILPMKITLPEGVVHLAAGSFFEKLSSTVPVAKGECAPKKRPKKTRFSLYKWIS